MLKQCDIIDFHKTPRRYSPWILRNAIHCLTHEDMFAVILGHIDEHVIELPERVIVWIATEDVRHWFIQITLVDFVHRIWHIHSSNKLHSYSNMWTCWMRNEPNPKLLRRRTYTSYWQIQRKANSWRLDWNEWKWSSPPHWMNARLSLRSMGTIWPQGQPCIPRIWMVSIGIMRWEKVVKPFFIRFAILDMSKHNI